MANGIQQPSQLQQIGTALQGFGAGIGGTLPQFQQAQNQKEQLQQQQQERQRILQQQQQEQQRQMEEARQKASFTDAQAALKLLDDGNFSALREFGINRLQSLQQLGGDPADTQRLMKLSIAAGNGSKEAEKLLRDELKTTVDLGEALGILEGPEIVKGGDIVDGQVVTQAGGIFSAQKIEGLGQKRAGTIVQRFPSGGGEAESILSDGKGGFTDLAGKKIKLDKKDRLIAGSSLTGGESELGLGDTEAKGLRDSEISARNLISSTNEAVDLLKTEPNINTLVARASGIVNGIKSEARAASETFGFEFDESLFNPDNYKGDFNSLGIQNARMRSLITGLAYEVATSREGGRLSDKDISNAIKELGANASDPTSFIIVLEDVARRADRNFRNNFQVRTRSAFEGDLGLSRPDAFDPKTASDEELIRRLTGGF